MHLLKMLILPQIDQISKLLMVASLNEAVMELSYIY